MDSISKTFASEFEGYTFLGYCSDGEEEVFLDEPCIIIGQ